MHSTYKFALLSLLIFSVASASAPVPCATDIDCQMLNAGNVCMDGICGYAQEPMIEESVDNCTTDDFCFGMGYDYCGQNGSCVPHEPLLDVMETVDNCNTNEFCINAGSDVCGAQGFCANETEDACATDYFCSTHGFDFCSLGEDCTYSEEYGLSHCTSAGFCEYENPYGEYACETDEYCQENNFGNECMDGVCGWVEPPVQEGCLPTYACALAFAFALFASLKKL